MTTRLISVLAAVGVLALSGCTGSEEGSPGTSAGAPSGQTTTPESEEAAVETLEAVEPPADAATLAAPGLALSVPAGWETGDQSADGLTQLTARGELDDGTRAALNLVGVPAAETDLATGLADARSFGDVRTETQVSLPQLSTTGSATLLDLDVAIDGQPARTWVLVFEHEGSTYNVTFLAEPFDEALARETLGTLRDA